MMLSDVRLREILLVLLTGRSGMRYAPLAVREKLEEYIAIVAELIELRRRNEAAQ